MDCDEALPQLSSEGYQFDLILTDPPYNLGKDFGNDSDKLSLNDFLNKTRERAKWCKELLSDCGSIVWFGIHRYIGFIQAIMYDLPLYYRRMIIWHYENGFSRSKREPAATYEPILWFSKSKSNWIYNADDLRVPYKSNRVKNPVYYKGPKGERKAWLPNPLGALRGDVWDFPTLAGRNYVRERTDHPTQKPESLITELIKAFCPKNEEGYYQGSVLDPFHGSGTLGVCCESLNLDGHKISWIGIEIEKKWCDIASKRLKDVRALRS